MSEGDKWHWLAGVIDARAGIAIYEYKKTFAFDWRPTISVRSKDKEVANMLAKNFPVLPVYVGNKGNYIIQLQRMDDIDLLLTKVEPLLKNERKKELAKLMLEYVKLRKKAFRSQHFPREKEIFERMKTLNSTREPKI